MKKFNLIFFIILTTVLFCGCATSSMCGMPNPWIECGDNLECAAKKAGFQFPLVLSNYQVRAMSDMIEITYPLDEFRNVIVRKSLTETDNLDISGDYNKYPVNKEYTLPNTVVVNIRGNEELVNVMYFGAESGCFSVQNNEGMSYDEIYQIFKMIEEVEAPKF